MDNKILLVLALPMLFAAPSAPKSTEPQFADKLVSIMCNLYFQIEKIIPVLLVISIAVAALVYLGSQLFGAETKAKGSSMAQSIIIGTIVTVLIILIAPWIVSSLLGQDLNSVCSGY